MLTPRQHQLLMFINSTLLEKGVCPSVREMSAAMNMTSRSGVHGRLSALRERGFITWEKGHARSIRVLMLPEDAGMTPDTDRVRALETENAGLRAALARAEHGITLESRPLS